MGLVVGGRYRIERFIGRGRHGEVYFARHVTVGRAVAIKALRRELTTDPTAVARFVQEAQAVAALGHPNVVEVTDAGDLPDRTPFLVMEWLEGEPLSSYMRRTGPLPPTRAAEIVVAIASGLAACHGIGVIHRDLKPDNVVLARTPTGELPKVVDFGLARVTTGDKKLTAHGAVVGDFRYAAPEQVSGGPVDGRVDVYALGCVLFELVVGRPPQRGEPIAPALGPFAPIAARAYAVARDQRFATMDAFREALLEAANGTSATFAPIVAMPVPAVAVAAARTEPQPAAPATKASRRWLLPAILATLALVGTAVTAAVFVLRPTAVETTTSGASVVPLAPPLAAPPAAPVVPDPVPAAPTTAVATTNVRIESTGAPLEIRLGDRAIGDTPLSIARPTGEERITLTVASAGHELQSLVLDARSPEVVRVGREPTPTQTPHAPTRASQGASRLAAPPHAARPASEHTAAPAPPPTPAPPPAATRPVANPQDMIDPWQ